MGGLGNRGNSGQQLTRSAHLDKPLDPGHDVSDRGVFARGICNSAIFSTFPTCNHERISLYAHDTIVRDAWSSIQGTTVDHVSYVVCYDVLLVLDWPAVCARVLFYHSGSTHQFHFVSVQMGTGIGSLDQISVCCYSIRPSVETSKWDWC